MAADALPDVVLEVDNTTDVRRNKLGLYESWGFPEVWVEVPDEPEPEIHRALNEPELSEQTAEVLDRMGRALGAAEGTGPDDDPFLRRQRRHSRAAGHAEGRAEALRASALQVLRSRDIPVSASLSERLTEMGGVSEHLVDAALQCRDEEHFLRLVSGTR